METRNDIRPFYPVHPGVILREELKERGIKQKDFAQMIGMQPTHLNALLHGTRTISTQVATRLEAALQIPAQLWLNLQSNYNLDTLRSAELVDGYAPRIETPTYALAEPSPSELDDITFRAGVKYGRSRLLEEILQHLINKGYSPEEAHNLIGQ